LPTSSTEPRRFNGIEAAMLASYSAPRPARPSVLMLPGITALTVIPYFANSMQAVRMKPSWPAFVAP